MFKYSATQWIYGNEPLDISLARLKRFGYDGVELAGEPYDTDVEHVRQLLNRYGLVCTSICGMYTPERDLSSSDERVRHQAVQYVSDTAEMAARLGAAHVIVVPTYVGKLAPETTRDREWGNAVESVREAARLAAGFGVQLAIEAINRYETYLVPNLTLAKQFMTDVDSEHVQLMADLFHMNIEENHIRNALIEIGKHLIHVHIADNTREAAGMGTIDFQEVVQTLREIGYQGPLTMEFLPAVSNPYLVKSQGGDSNILDRYTEQAIAHLKQFTS